RRAALEEAIAVLEAVECIGLEEGATYGATLLRALLDAPATVRPAPESASEDRLREAVYEAIAELEEHAEDGECAGPDGTGRRGACQECSIARRLRGALLDAPAPETT